MRESLLRLEASLSIAMAGSSHRSATRISGSTHVAMTSLAVMRTVPAIVAERPPAISAMRSAAPRIASASSIRAVPVGTLTLILEELPAARLGYGVYLLYPLLFAFVGTAIVCLAVRGTPGERSPRLSLAIALAAVSALARAIDIIRWLMRATRALGSTREDGVEAADIEAARLAVNVWGVRRANCWTWRCSQLCGCPSCRC